MEMSGWCPSLVNMWAMPAVSGKCGNGIAAMCVDCIVKLSSIVMVSGCVVGCLLWHSPVGSRKCPFAPLSRMAVSLVVGGGAMSDVGVGVVVPKQLPNMFALPHQELGLPNWLPPMLLSCVTFSFCPGFLVQHILLVCSYIIRYPWDQQ